MKLRSHLLVLTASTLLPMIVFALAASVVFARRERATFQRGATERTLALLTAVDTKLRASITTLEALATSRRLDVGDLRGFHEAAQRVLRSQPDWFTINLALPSARQVVNVVRLFGVELPPVGEPRSLGQVLRTGRPAAGHLVAGPISGQHEFSVRVPVVRDGVTKYVLSAVVRPQAISALLSAQRLPADWVAVVLDGNNSIVARTVGPERTLGEPASESLQAALAGSAEGWFRGSTLEGWPVYTPFNRSAFSGWTVAMGIPAAALDADAHRAMWAMTAGLLLAGLFAVVLALALGRRVAEPIVSLAAAAKAIGRGERPEIPRTARVEEVGDVGRALEDAATAVRAREESQGQLAAIVEASSDAIISYSLEGIVRTWNPAATRLFGYTAGESRGRHVSFLVPADRTEERDAVFTAAAAGQSSSVETVRLRKDGTAVQVALTVSPIRNAAGVVTGLSAAVRDITEQKQAERALRDSEEKFVTLAEVVPQLVWITSADGSLEYFNRRWYDYTGTTPEETLGSRSEHALHPDDREAVRGQWREVLRTGEPLEIECRLQGADGQFRWFLVRGVPFRGADGRILKWFGTFTNIEGQKRAEEALRASDRTKDEFLAMLSHELRNPLGVIAAAVGVLDVTDGPPETAARARAIISRQVAHLSRLVDDLLDVGRVRTGKVVLDQRRVDLAEVVANALSALRSSRRLDRHQVIVDAAPVWVNADETRIEQVVSNLVGNALKYTPGGGRIAVRVGPDGAAAVLEITDTGVGIPAGLLDKVFDLFMQGDRTLDRAQSGLGIGLTLVKALVTIHGGTVEAKSDGPGRGAVFTVRLPRVGAPAPPPPASAPRREGARRRILIVEDNEDAREMLSVGLTLMGHEVHGAADGPAGIQAAADIAPDVALIDLGLPVLDGFEVARRIRAGPGGPAILLIAVTGYGQAEDRHRALEAGFDAHTTKPVLPERLAEHIAGGARDRDSRR